MENGEYQKLMYEFQPEFTSGGAEPPLWKMILAYYQLSGMSADAASRCLQQYQRALHAEFVKVAP